LSPSGEADKALVVLVSALEVASAVVVPTPPLPVPVLLRLLMLVSVPEVPNVVAPVTLLVMGISPVLVPGATRAEEDSPPQRVLARPNAADTAKANNGTGPGLCVEYPVRCIDARLLPHTHRYGNLRPRLTLPSVADRDRTHVRGSVGSVVTARDGRAVT